MARIPLLGDASHERAHARRPWIRITAVHVRAMRARNRKNGEKWATNAVRVITTRAVHVTCSTADNAAVWYAVETKSDRRVTSSRNFRRFTYVSRYTMHPCYRDGVRYASIVIIRVISLARVTVPIWMTFDARTTNRNKPVRGFPIF